MNNFLSKEILKNYFRWNLMMRMVLWYFLKFQLGFLMNESKAKKCLNSNESELNFPEPVCKFKMSLLLTSDFENKWKPANKIEHESKIS